MTVPDAQEPTAATGTEGKAHAESLDYLLELRSEVEYVLTGQFHPYWDEDERYR